MFRISCKRSRKFRFEQKRPRTTYRLVYGAIQWIKTHCKCLLRACVVGIRCIFQYAAKQASQKRVQKYRE